MLLGRKLEMCLKFRWHHNCHKVGASSNLSLELSEYFLLSGVFSNWRFRSSFTSNHNCLVKLFDRHFCSVKMRVNDSKQFYSLRESIIHCFFSPEYSYTIQKQWCLHWSKRQYGIFRAIKYSYGTANSCFFINSFCISIPFWPEKY